MSDKNQFDEESIVSTVLSFINAKTWAESKAIVQANKDDLLTPEAFQVFEALLMQYKDDEKARNLLEDHRSLLLRCQSEGIDAAFADRLQAQSTSDIPPELLARLRSIRSEAELRELIEEHPELLPVSQQMAVQPQAPQESSTDVSSPDELSALLQELQGLNRLSDMPRRVELCQNALRLVDRNDQPELWAKLQMERGNSLAQNPLGKHAENIELAIDHYNQALQVYTREAFPEDWAMIQYNMAIVYGMRIRGKLAENIELAIDHCNQALQVYTREAFPENWADTQNNLAKAYTVRIRGDRAENIELAIDHYNQALQVFTLEAFPVEWARTQNNLADSYNVRIRDDRAENIDLAIDHCNQALKVYTREAFPEDWAWTQGNLASAYRKRIRGNRAKNIELAIDNYNQALEVFTLEAFPEDWALTQNNLANAYSNRIQGDRAKNIELAIDHYNQALQVRTLEAFPVERAGIQHSLASAYLYRIQGERAENIELAIDLYKQALQVHTREAFPEDWAGTQNNLAAAYIESIHGERAENIELAIDLYKQALQVRTLEAFPEDWAGTQNNLASAYVERIRGVRAENIDIAIEHYTYALGVYTREAFPEKWALTQNNLANAYSNRIQGERAENIDLAIEHYNQALQVYTREAFPENWAGTQDNLANAYWVRISGERGKNIDLAIQHHTYALGVYTQDAFPAYRRKTLRNLGHLYFTEQSWENALTNYNGAIEAGNAVLAEAYTEVGRKAEVGETSKLYARSAYCLLKLEQIDKAVLRLEEGKTRLLTEALAMTDADLDMLSETQGQTMSKAREAVRLMENATRLLPDARSRKWLGELGYQKIGEMVRQKRIELNELVDTLRLQHSDFMPTGLDLPGILGLIPEGGALIAPLVTSKGSAVIVISHGADSVGTDNVVMLDSLTEDDMLKLLQGPADNTEWGGWMGAYFAFRDEGTEAAMEQWLEVIEKSTSQLWTMLMDPVHQKLQGLNLDEGAPVILMPQGYLGLLPLHAAWRDVDGEKRAFIDDYTVNYAPSAYSLSISSERIQDATRQKASLLAVINPTEDLPYTPVEGMAVESLFDPEDRETLPGNVATKKAVVEKVPGWTYLHFSCHGIYDFLDVMNSGLELANHDILTLSEIISDLDLKTARLVTLSACETGMTDIQQSPDEFIGLPIGFLQAGAAGVVSTLWAVSDAATSLLIKHFYRKHLKEGLPPDKALRSAQLWLRDATRQELGDTYKSLTRMSHHEAYRELVMDGDTGDKPYTNPFYWAAFTFTGK